MKKIFTICFVLFSLLTNDKAYSQSVKWGYWSTVSCYKGFQVSAINYGYVKTINQYSWNWRIKSNYPKTVHVNISLTIGGESRQMGRFTLNPGQTREHVSTYFSSPSTSFFVEVTEVCFLGTWASCKDGCYATCDNGSPNQPDCNNSSTSTRQTANNSNQNSTYQTQQQDNSANQQREQLAKQKSDEEFESKTGSWTEYGQKANSSYKAGDYESAVKYAKLQVSASANDAQRENAQLWLDEYTKAKQNAGGSNQNSSQQLQQQNIANQQEQQRQQQELKRQEDAKRTAAYIDLGVKTISGIASLVSDISENRRNAQQEKYAKMEEERNMPKNTYYREANSMYYEVAYGETSKKLTVEQKKEKFEKIQQKYLLAYENGNLYALYQIARMSFDNLKDFTNAAYMFEKFFSQANSKEDDLSWGAKEVSAMTLSLLYLKGEVGFAKNEETAFKWLEVYETLNKDSKNKYYDFLGNCFLNEAGLIHNYSKALYYYEKTDTKKNPYVFGQISKFYINGWGVEKDLKKGLKYLSKGCDAKDKNSCESLEKYKNEK